MLKVGDIMTPDPQVVRPGQTVAEASQLMEERRIGSLPVVERGKLVGIITSRDLRLTPPDCPVADVMTKEVITVYPETTLEQAQQMLEEHKIERLVVVDKAGRVTGIITETVLYGEFWRYWDTLTRLPKVTVLQKKGEELLRQGREISLIFLDLNEFGQIDKEYGHVFGDRILQEVATIFHNRIDSARDFLCRYGGDEFAVVSTRNLRGAVALAWQMVCSLQENQWPAGASVSCAAGIAGGRRRKSRPERPDLVVSQLLNLASLASTRAKKSKKLISVASRVECEAAYSIAYK
ncbi:MAG: CBS domain-containing protein [Firmicutes bacterium]|nr:CBS domain-containing protein [Bacillota bacterium]